MNIFITGASGFIGRHLIAVLLKSGHNITACTYKTELPFAVKILKFDFANMRQVSNWLPYLKDIEVVINCVGIIAETKKHSFEVMHYLAAVALFKACEQSQIKRVVQISALGADNLAIVNYHKTKKRADDYLRQSSLAWFVLRPSLVFGSNGKSFNFFRRLSKLPIVPLIGSGEQMIQPVHIDTVIQSIEQCLRVKQTNQTIDVVGERAISYKDWMLQLRQKPNALFIKIPIKLMKLLAWLTQPFKLALISRDNLIMLEQNNVADHAPLKIFLENSK
ncbi:hypothetical protein MNBD_GAMMA01-1890 [hydrothermal vent metagenome]|uniref:NAD(P)-binding domain-containing protein n=1 Tax=hydrothermal vent metagenome TaxID=652676 RepID=A0A3B0V3W5_9ZZZZ